MGTRAIEPEDRHTAGLIDFVPQAEIDLSSLRSNLQQVRVQAPASGVWAVIKANAYGHGAVAVARALGDSDGLAVARVDEALRLRAAGISSSILVLEGPLSVAELEVAVAARLELVVHQFFQLEMLESQTPFPLRLWLKLDSGMHRLGFDPEQAPAVFQRLRDCSGLSSPPVLMSHLANADDPTDPTTRAQTRRFLAVARALPETDLSLANSAGILGWPDSHLDRVRPGIMLYGISPFVGETGADRGLHSVMTLRARLIAVKRCRVGDALGYGGAYVCPQDMTVGVVGIGYGDGYPRHAPDGTPVLLNGQRAPLIGRVSMDMLSVDLRSQPQARVGDPVVLWGKGLPVEEIATAAGTIAYELLCGLSDRVLLHEAATDVEGDE